MSQYFVQCGYPRAPVEKTRRKVENLSRNSLLDNTHTTAKEKHEGRMVMPITFHPINNSEMEGVKQHYPILKYDNEAKDVFPKNLHLVQSIYSPVNLGHYITTCKPTTNCNRRFFNGFVIRKVWTYLKLKNTFIVSTVQIYMWAIMV